MPDENKIFKYSDGFGDVFGDPFEIDYKFDRAVMERNEDLDLLNKWITDVPRDTEGNPDVEKFDKGQERMFMDACMRYVPLIRTALDLKPFDRGTGEGLTNVDVLRTWREYVEWKIGVKKNTDDLPPSGIPTDSVPNSSGASTVQLPPTGPYPPRPSTASRPTSAGVTPG